WESPKVQQKVSEATSAVKEKAPEAQDHLKDAVKKAGGSITGLLHRNHGSQDREQGGAADLEQATYSGQPAATVENPAVLDPEPGTSELPGDEEPGTGPRY
ncbi:hypothetical protein HER39_12175, partial [Arthrobacter deserti]|nr:hypothetical protein [Arthrobacter deserti]